MRQRAEARAQAERWTAQTQSEESEHGSSSDTLAATKRAAGFLWRFMVAPQFQGKGLGRRALELLVFHVRSRPNAHTLLTSCRPGGASPEPFYVKCGFRRTGSAAHGEVELALSL